MDLDFDLVCCLANMTFSGCRKHFGVYHPIYLHALQNFVNFSNEYRQDVFGVEASLAAINIASKLYGYHSSQVARAYTGKSVTAACCAEQSCQFTNYQLKYWITLDKCTSVTPHGFCDRYVAYQVMGIPPVTIPGFIALWLKMLKNVIGCQRKERLKFVILNKYLKVLRKNYECALKYCIILKVE